MPMESLPLRDIHLPDPIGWWPLAPGWWGVGCLLLFIIAGLFWWRRKKRRMGPIPWQVAIRELDQLEIDAAILPREKLQALSILMKRTAVSIKGRTAVAGLAGDDWLEWLDEAWPGEARFTRGVGRLLWQGPYRQQPDLAELPQIFSLCREWMLDMRKVPVADTGAHRSRRWFSR